MALHLHLLPPPALTITTTAAPGTGGGARSAGAARPPPRSLAPSFSCSPGRRGRRPSVAVAAGREEQAAGGGPAGPMRLNEYMVAVDRPLGVRFALGVDGRVFVHSLRKGGNAEKSRIIMVGDTLKKAGAGQEGGGLVTIKDLGDTEYGTSNVMLHYSKVKCPL